MAIVIESLSIPVASIKAQHGSNVRLPRAHGLDWHQNASSLTTWVTWVQEESGHQVESSVQFEEFAVSEPCLRTSILTSEPILPSILNRFTAQAFRLGFQHIHGRCDLSIWFSVFWLPGNVDVGNVQMARNRGRDKSCHQACCDVHSTSCVPRNRERICADLCN